jgi:hypothetical protein
VRGPPGNFHILFEQALHRHTGGSNFKLTDLFSSFFFGVLRRRRRGMHGRLGHEARKERRRREPGMNSTRRLS